jgi:hypothetical protein
MAEKILIGQKELLRSKVLEMVKREKMTLKQAAGQLKLNYRQILRVCRPYLEGGDATLMRFAPQNATHSPKASATNGQNKYANCHALAKGERDNRDLVSCLFPQYTL